MLATDSGGERLSASFTFAVTDVNEAPMAIGALADQRASTGQPFILTLPTVPWSDPDAGDTLTLAVREPGGGALPAWLSFDPASGELTGTPPGDALGELRLAVVASDGGGLSAAPLELRIEIVDGNTAPTAIGLEATPVAENVAGAAIGRLTASDPDAGDTATYAVVDDARFTIVGEELRLASGESLDFEATPSVEVEIVATDSGGASRRETFAVAVTDVNEAPTAIGLEATPVVENVPGAAIGRLTASDPDAGDTATYAVVGDARFTIVGEELRLASGESLDFEATPSVEVEIVATDSGGASRRETFAVAVTDVNEAPTAIALEAMPVAENAPGATIGRVTSSDPDAGDTASYAVVDDARFTIVGEELRLTSGESLDFETTPSVEVEIVATDSGGETLSESFTFTVTDANDAPLAAIPPPNVTLGPNESYTLPPDAFTDPDGDPLVVSAPVLPDWAGFDTASRTLFVLDVDAAGIEPVSAPADARFVASDGRGGTAALEATLRREPGDSAPPRALEDRYALREGDTLVVDDAARSLLANDSVDEGRAPLSASLVEGPAHGTLTLASDGTFRYAHAGGEQLVDSFRYRVSDGSGALSAPVEVTLLIEPVNDVPRAARDIETQTVREGETFALAVDASTWSDPDPGDSLSVAIEMADGGPLPDWLEHDAERGVLAGTPGRDDVGVLDLRLVARDESGAAAAPLDMRLLVANVNEPPDDIVLTNEGVPENAAGAFVGTLSASDPDGGDTARFTTADPRFAIVADRLSLSADTALDFETSSLVSVEITATDPDGAAITRALDVRVLDANDAPVLAGLVPPAESAEALRYAVPDTAFVDTDGDTLSYRATRVDGEALPAWLAFDAQSRVFTITSPAGTADDELTVDVRLFAEDGRGGAAFADLTFRRTPAPVTGLAEPVPERLAPLPVQTATTLMPPPRPSAAAASGAPPDADAPADSGDGESPREAAGNTLPNEPSALPAADHRGATTIDLHELLAGLGRESGALELIDVSATSGFGLLSEARFLDEGDIDTIDLGALLDGSDPLSRRAFGELADTLDAERDELDQRAALARTLIGGSAGVTSGLSVGYLLWLIRGGTLMGSVLSSLPAWRFVDPLPVLGTLAEGIDADGDDESLETLVAGQPEARA